MPTWLLWLIGIGLVAGVTGWAVRRFRRGPGRPSRPGRAPRRPRGRPTAPPRPRSGPATKPAEPRVRPQPGEIWWADVPFEDGTGSKVRPCLVLRGGRRGADVLKITSQDKSERDDHVKIPTRSWDRTAARDSWLDLSDPITVSLTSFENRAGSCDADLWHRVTQLHRVRRTR
ncbi:type II toxin-antitoxin system PemK/MazF family toxin [Micromonospora sp. NBC_01796]|uniref:type II toxin-antitoxin system PemK/MazF family toxin n=1 Tax=Micromonospora sp. NBC_01796 TaxID=2975987 RepID=UPI002DDA2790|nr:type II toxin-antitoxin system PemK/MazF family toxin [Micromonospora sp. NBC_01796]WSA87232.1 type II toxin-antitoxin system PemK/MazF family toxin [Micromonospora sp. NBC_01796]